MVKLLTYLRQDSLLCRLCFVLSRAAQHLVVNDQLYINMLLRLHHGDQPLQLFIYAMLCFVHSVQSVQTMAAGTNAWKEEE